MFIKFDDGDRLAELFTWFCSACQKFPDGSVEEWCKSKGLDYSVMDGFDDFNFDLTDDTVIITTDDKQQNIFFRNPKHAALFTADGYGGD